MRIPVLANRTHGLDPWLPRSTVKMALGAAKSALYDSASQVRGQARRVTRTTDAYVHDNPWQVVGIAAVVGVVLGVMMSRRSD